MKKILGFSGLAVVLALAGCAQQEVRDTRAQSFMASDTNRDLRLTYGEYQTYLKAQAANSDAEANRLLYDTDPEREKTILVKFQQTDMNRDTFVSREELGIGL